MNVSSSIFRRASATASAPRTGELLRLPPKMAAALAVTWVAGIALLYLVPSADRAWWAVPFHAFDTLLDIPGQLVPGGFVGRSLGRAAGGVVVAVFVAGACAAAGDLFVGLLRARPASRLWRLCAALGAGSWVVSTQALVLGAMGVMSPWIHGGALAAWIVAWAAFVSQHGRRTGEKAAATERTAQCPAGFLCWTVAAIAMVLLVQFVAALTPPLEYDTLEYHLGAPAWYIDQGRIGFMPGNVYANFPALTEMLYLEGLVLGSEASAKLLHFLFGCATALAIAAWAGRRWTRDVGVTGAALFLALPFTMQLAMTARIDLATAFLGFLAIADAVAVREEGRKAAVRAALFAGAACCTKYTAALLVAIPAGVVVGWAAAGNGKGASLSLRRGLVWGAAAIAAAAAMTTPWLVKNWLLTGNPVYPLLSSWLGGRDWSAELNTLFRVKHLHPDAATGLLEFLRKPFVYSVVEPGALPIFLILLPLLALRRNEAAYPGIRLAGLGVLLMVVAWGWGTYAPWRFLFPALGMLCVLASAATDGWATVPPVRRSARAGVAFCLAWGIMFQVVTVGTDLHQPGRYPAVVTPFTFASGRVARENFVRPVADAIFWMNEHLPKDALVLYAGEARTYYATHRFLANTVYNHSAVRALLRDTADEWEIALRARMAGITHVYVNGSELRRLHENYGYLDAAEIARLQRFLDAYGRLVYGVEGRQAVYQLIAPAEVGT